MLNWPKDLTPHGRIQGVTPSKSPSSPLRPGARKLTNVLVFLVLVLLASLPAAGCIAVVPYQPRSALVAEQGLPEVKRLLSEVTRRAINPHITTVDVQDDFLWYSWTETYPGPFYVPVTTSHQNQIYFANIGRIELYENNNVYVWGPGDSRRDMVLFADANDAKLFIDCLNSLKAARVK